MTSDRINGNGRPHGLDRRKTRPTGESISFWLVHLIRRPPVFRAFRGELDPMLFDREGEYHFRFLIEGLLEHYKASDDPPPTSDVLSSLVSHMIQSSPTGAPPGTIESADAIIAAAYSSGWEQAFSPAQDTLAFEYGRDVLSERVVAEPYAERLQVSSATTYGVDHAALLDDAVRRQQRISSIGVVTAFDHMTVPDELEDDDVDPIPCGVEYIDSRMGGGSRSGEVHTMLGPSGGGKTLNAIHKLVSSAEELEKRGADPRLVNFYFFFEGGIDEARARVMSRAACIHVSRSPRSKAQYARLSTRGRLEPYEQQLFHGVPDPDGEKERYEKARDLLNKRIRIVDYSGARKTGSRGAGGVDEIAAHIHGVCADGNVIPNLVLVDWAGTCVRRYLASRGTDLEKGLRLELGNFVDQVYQKITGYYGCTGWVYHQLASEFTQRNPAVDLHYSMAQDCRNFSDRAWFAFILGPKDVTTNCCSFTVSKTRGGPPIQRGILRIDGDIGRMTDVSDSYTFEGGHIVRKHEAETFRVAPPAAQPPQRPGIATPAAGFGF